jgi:hypothetical protein
VLLGDGARSSMVEEMLERVNPAEIGAFYEREMPLARVRRSPPPALRTRESRKTAGQGTKKRPQ